MTKQDNPFADRSGELVPGRIKRYRQRLLALLDSPSHTIQEILEHKSAHEKPGVYAIFLPGDSEVVYVGRNKTKAIADRIWQHRYVDTPSDLRGMVKRHPHLPRDIGAYCVRYVVEEDKRDRLFFGNFVIGCLAPPMNK
ncbi:MAG: GIY-YIG nuclease family protein [Planctomycetota bacterium]